MSCKHKRVKALFIDLNGKNTYLCEDCHRWVVPGVVAKTRYRLAISDVHLGSVVLAALTILLALCLLNLGR